MKLEFDEFILKKYPKLVRIHQISYLMQDEKIRKQYMGYYSKK